MNDLQVKTIKFEPATVEFNYEELAAKLDENLQKYQGLTFTEKDAAECKKTITELNKGKKAVDSYRKETKKKLTASVTEFENQCKDLNKRFDEVITPLKEQHDAFENSRKEAKQKLIQDIINDLVKEQGLNEKYAKQLVITNEYLTKSKSLKSIKEELTAKTESLGIQQDNDEANQEIIKGHVELINTKKGVELIPASYTGLLDYGAEVATIKQQIEKDADITLQNKQLQEEVEQTEEPEHPEEEETFMENYQVVGTENQLNELEEYMSSKGLTWKLIENA